MASGIERAPVYPDIPIYPLTKAQEESFMAFEVIDEFRELVIRTFAINSGGPYRLTEADLQARRHELAEAQGIMYSRSRSTRELATFVLATVSQMEEEFRQQKVLDIGCGIGRFGESIARNAKAEVTFLDRDVESLQKISRRAGEIVLGDGSNLPFEDETFSRVVSSFSSVHWAESPLESVQALNEAIRVTEVGGSTIIIPLFNGIDQRRQLLPILASSLRSNGQIEDIDRYVAVWTLQDLAVIESLYGLAEDRYCAITWSNVRDEIPFLDATLDRYSVVIDKHESIPNELYAENLTYAKQLTSKNS